MTVATFEGYIRQAAIIVRAAIEPGSNPKRAHIVIFDRWEHDEGWEVSGRVQFWWEEGLVCKAEFTEIPSFSLHGEREQVIEDMIQELEDYCPEWAEGDLWVMREVSSNRKLDPAHFDLLPHYRHLEALLYVLGADKSLAYQPRQVVWSMINRFGGFARRQHQEWTRKTK